MSIVGQIIVRVRTLSPSEKEREGWSDHPGPVTAIMLGNGTVLFASSDPEGNAPGALFGVGKDGDGFTLLHHATEGV